MDWTWNHGLGRFLVRLQAGRAQIQNRIQTKLRLGRTWIHGLAFLALSIVLGWSAYEWSNEQWRINWLERRRPSQSVWETAIRSKRYIKVESRDWQWAFQRALNSTLLDQSDIWISSDRIWIAVHPDRPTGELEIWSLIPVSKKTPVQILDAVSWEALGRGWAGLESFMERLTHPPTLPTTTQKKRIEYRDPREIRY